MEAAASALPADGHGLTLLPFPSGERAPGWNLDAKAAIVGLTRATTQPQVYRATLEAVALRLGSIIRLLAGASLAHDAFLRWLGQSKGRPPVRFHF